MREQALELIKQHGPISVSSLERLTGLGDKAARNAIDQLRARGEPIWLGANGFWFSAEFRVPTTGPGRWKREPSNKLQQATVASPKRRPEPAVHRASSRIMTPTDNAPVFKTPIIPDWIRKLSAPPYVNIFDLSLGNRNLFGTETLLGDWEGLLLIVAKDFAPADEVLAAASEVAVPTLAYRHNDGDGRYRTGHKTNTNLLRLIFGAEGAVMIRGEQGFSSGVLYTSACFFLKPGPKASSNLEDWRPGTPHFEGSMKVFKFVLDNMPNLKAIVCLGRDSAALMRAVLSQRLTTRGAGPFLGELSHPAARGKQASSPQDWQRFLEAAKLHVDHQRVVTAR